MPELPQVVTFKRQMLADLLSRCTEPQQALFARIWMDFKEVPEKDLDNAIRLCERTLHSNAIKEMPV